MSARHHVSGSVVDRFLGCQHWAHAGTYLPVIPQTPAMANGTRRHKLAESALRGANPFPDPDDLAITNAAVALRERVSVLQVEQGYALNPLTGTSRMIAGRGDDGYQSLSPDEVPLTIDVVYRDIDGTIVVRDWKLGARGIEFTPSPEISGQLLAGLLAVRAHGAFTCNTMAVEFADDTNVKRAPVTHALLNEFAERMMITWGAMVTAPTPPEPTAGPHCHWCPLEHSCPAPFAIVTQATAPITDGKARLPIAIATQEDADVWATLEPMITNYMKRMSEQFREYATTHVVTKVENGTTYQFGTTPVKGRESVALSKMPSDVRAILEERKLITKGEPTVRHEWKKI